jgi:hypothetical protein
MQLHLLKEYMSDNSSYVIVTSKDFVEDCMNVSSINMNVTVVEQPRLLLVVLVLLIGYTIT